MSTPKSLKKTSSPSITMSNSRLHQSRLVDSPLATSSVASHYDLQHYAIKSSESLPVLVNEALSTGGSNANASMQFSADGWAWLIVGVKLFVWKISQAKPKRICKELILDTGSDKHYDAQLAVVGPCPNAKNEGAISAVALTSDGHVTFWQNIIRSVTSAVYLDAPDLGFNEEFLKIVPFKGRGYIAVTTDGDLYELNPGGFTIGRTQLRRSTGVLAGIGRRVSSIFFRQDNHVDVLNLVLLQSSQGCCDIILLTAESLQRRKVSSVNQSGYNQLVREVDIRDLLADKISKTITANSKADFEIFPMDITVSSKSKDFAVLVGCPEHGSSQNISLKYFICICPLSVLSEAHDITSSLDQVRVFQLGHTEENLVSHDEIHNDTYKLIIPTVSNHELPYAIIWTRDTVVIKSLGKDGYTHEELIQIDPNDYILGAGELNNHAILFESTKGLLSVESVPMLPNFIEPATMLDSPNMSSENSIKNQLSRTPNTSSVSRKENLDPNVDQAQRLQSAFIHFSHMNISHARSIIEESFAGTGQITSLKEAVISMSLDLIDDFPALDPRWAESLPQGNSSSSSLILQHQLKDKQKAHQIFLNFLTEVSIWDLLGQPMSAESGQMLCVQWTLIEHQEKLEAAVALVNKHIEKQGILDSAIQKVIGRRGNEISSSELTAEDIFYRQVSQIQDIFKGILDVEEDAISNSSMTSRELTRLILAANEIFDTILTAVHDLRRRRGGYHKNKGIEFCPWTISSQHGSVREAVLRQHAIIFLHGIPEVDDAQTRSTLHLNAVALTDILLSEYQWQMDSLACVPSLSARSDELTESFQKHRSETITRILEAGVIEKAAALAEKFQDFNILMEIWYRKDSENLLFEYVSKFEKFGFVDTFFTWLLERGKFRQLLYYTTCNAIASEEFTNRAAEFMSSHPRINWLHQIKTNDLLSAHKTLLYLAETESRSCAAKSHYVSLSKLAAAFSDEPRPMADKAISDSTSLQTLLKYQETLPSAVLQTLGITVDEMPVYSPEELIKFYIGDDNIQANEVDFMKALDLLSFIPVSEESPCQVEDGSDNDVASEIMNLKHLIWCKAILQDSWHEINCGVDNLKASSHTVLAKTLRLALQSGMLLDYLPDMEHLLEQELLSSVKNNASSQFLVRLNFHDYERQVLGSQADSTECAMDT